MHPLFYIVCFTCFITGYFRKYIFFLFLLLIHELGHILVAHFFSWKIKKIKILPFGGITIFENFINVSLKQELLVSISGVMFQTLGYFILSFFYDKTLFISIHYALIIFNLLPIFPLDGSKIWNAFFNFVFPFKKSYTLSIIISFFFILILILFAKSLSSVLILLFLLKTEIKEIKYRKIYFYKFLLERCMYSFKYSKISYIDNIVKMRRNYYHYICFEKEQEFLKKLFKINKILKKHND